MQDISASVSSSTLPSTPFGTHSRGPLGGNQANERTKQESNVAQ